MSAVPVVCAAVVLGYILGRLRPAHRASDWANWELCQRPTGVRRAVVSVLLGIEAAVLITLHPVRCWRVWKHRNDPPPRRAPAPTFKSDWIANRSTTPEEPQP